MKKVYEILFYRIYRFLVLLNHNDFFASLISLTLISFFISLNLLTIIFIFDIGITNLIKRPIFLFFIVLIFNSYLFLNKQNYLTIKSKYKNEDKKKRKVRILLTVIYILITFILFLI
jgi:hypothetical protein